jgi:hypothetical protein
MDDEISAEPLLVTSGVTLQYKTAEKLVTAPRAAASRRC